MRIITPSVEIIDQPSGLEGIYKMIELASRTCYKSENKITETSAQEFVNRMIESKHFSMLEHGTVYLILKETSPITGYKYRDNPYSKFVEILHKSKPRPIYTRYITTNYRHIVENGWLDDLQYLCEPTPFHEKRVSVRFFTQIAITREMNRHRVNSIAEQSTRFCNYGSVKFGNEVAINIPTWVTPSEYPTAFNQEESLTFKALCYNIFSESDQANFTAFNYWWFANKACEYAYLNLLRLGKKPQEARAILPLDTHTEIVHTAFVSDWVHFFELRVKGTTGAPHPDIKIIAEPLMNEFISRGLIVK